jgi:hypothetical protein
MDGRGTVRHGQVYNSFRAQVAVPGGGWSNTVGLIGLAHVASGSIGFGKDRNRLDAEAPAGPNNSAGDFAAISN